MKWIVLILGMCLHNNKLATNGTHPLYVSITNIEWNSTEKTVEGICKIFTDDLETTLATSGTKVDLYALPNAITKKILQTYTNTHLQLKINNTNYTTTLIGYERRKDACWCYFEIKNVPQPKLITVTNSILYEYTTKQINLVTCTVLGTEKSNKYSYPNTQYTFDY